MGLQIDNKSMEEMIMLATISDLLGTTWWTILCFTAGVVVGIWIKPWIMNKIR